MDTPASSVHRDRSAALVVFGIIEILLGILCLLMVPLMFLSLALARQQPGMQLQTQPLVLSAVFYVMIAALFIWLGIGSLLARRWARALWVCLSGLGLCGGAIALPFVGYTAAHLGDFAAAANQPQLPPAAQRVVAIVTVAMTSVIYIAIPGALFLFYRSPHVRRTCELKDPVERWTDRCPLPVLALSVLLAWGAVSLLSLLFLHATIPVFGTIVSGPAGAAVILALTALLLYLARGLYRLRPAAWWLGLGMLVVGGVSNGMTLWRGDFGALYAAMGLDARAVSIAAALGTTRLALWMGLLALLPWLAWLLYVRRFFRAQPAR